jgi:hypothetical protein
MKGGGEGLYGRPPSLSTPQVVNEVGLRPRPFTHPLSLLALHQPLATGDHKGPPHAAPPPSPLQITRSL